VGGRSKRISAEAPSRTSFGHIRMIFRKAKAQGMLPKSSVITFDQRKTWAAFGRRHATCAPHGSRSFGEIIRLRVTTDEQINAVARNPRPDRQQRLKRPLSFPVPQRACTSLRYLVDLERLAADDHRTKSSTTGWRGTPPGPWR